MDNPCRYAVYLLFWYKSTYTDSEDLSPEEGGGCAGTQFTCFTSTKVQILTPKLIYQPFIWRTYTYPTDLHSRYLDVCRRMLTYVCWRILTYADVCSSSGGLTRSLLMCTQGIPARAARLLSLHCAPRQQPLATSMTLSTSTGATSTAVVL